MLLSDVAQATRDWRPGALWRRSAASLGASHVASGQAQSCSRLAVVGLGGDEPLLADLVVGEVVDEHHVIDAHAYLGERLGGRGNIKEQDLFLSRRTEGLRRSAAGQDVLVLVGRPAGHLALAKSMQL